MDFKVIGCLLLLLLFVGLLVADILCPNTILTVTGLLVGVVGALLGAFFGYKNSIVPPISTCPKCGGKLQVDECRYQISPGDLTPPPKKWCEKCNNSTL